MEFLSRRELLDDWLTWKGGLGDSDKRDEAARLLNRAYMHIWMAHPFNDHRLPNPIQITTVQNQRTYALPGYFGRIPPRVTKLRNVSTARELEVRSLDDLTLEDPRSGTTLEVAGTPRLAAIGAPVGVSVQPSATGQALEIVSDSVDDIDIRVTVEGLDSTGTWNETQVTANGTTAVAIGTWKEPIVHFAKAFPAGTDPVTPYTSSRGTFTLRVVAGATLQTLLPEESGREFPSLVLSPKPLTAGEIIAIPAIRAPKRLLNDSDAIPQFWGEALLERMRDLVQVTDGESRGDNALYGPAVVRLIAHDNTRDNNRIRTRAFLG